VHRSQAGADRLAAAEAGPISVDTSASSVDRAVSRREDEMSAGPFSASLNAAAAYVLRSLMERPDRGTPDEIADASKDGDTITSGAAREGLDELRSRGLAEEASNGRWRLTERAR
jgi:hypothetical protein